MATGRYSGLLHKALKRGRSDIPFDTSFQFCYDIHLVFVFPIDVFPVVKVIMSKRLRCLQLEMHHLCTVLAALRVKAHSVTFN